MDSDKVNEKPKGTASEKLLRDVNAVREKNKEYYRKTFKLTVVFGSCMILLTIGTLVATIVTEEIASSAAHEGRKILNSGIFPKLIKELESYHKTSDRTYRQQYVRHLESPHEVPKPEKPTLWRSIASAVSTMAKATGQALLESRAGGIFLEAQGRPSRVDGRGKRAARQAMDALETQSNNATLQRLEFEYAELTILASLLESMSELYESDGLPEDLYE